MLNGSKWKLNALLRLEAFTVMVDNAVEADAIDCSESLDFVGASLWCALGGLRRADPFFANAFLGLDLAFPADPGAGATTILNLLSARNKKSKKWCGFLPFSTVALRFLFRTLVVQLTT
jgi:hypothetical protein